MIKYYYPIDRLTPDEVKRVCDRHSLYYQYFDIGLKLITIHFLDRSDTYIFENVVKDYECLAYMGLYETYGILLP